MGVRTLVKWCIVAVVFTAIGASLTRSDETPPARAAEETAATTTPGADEQAVLARKQRRRHHRTARRVAEPTPAATPAPPTFVSCDDNIRVRAATTTCPFAENVFYEYYEKGAGSAVVTRIKAWSPATKRFYATRCDAGSQVVCVAGDGGEVRFSSSALAAYDDDQAAAYVRAHDTGTRPAESTEYADPDPSYEDPEPYYEAPDDYTAPSTDYGEEIPNYDEGNGYRVQCADGMYSQSGGIQGACSGHGGVG